MQIKQTPEIWISNSARGLTIPEFDHTAAELTPLIDVEIVPSMPTA